jgi:four helix bundle protein
MNQDEMRDRTKKFALRVIAMVGQMPQDKVGWVLGKQVLRSGTSVGANYREACRGSSRKQFANSVEIALREADETLYWLELIMESNMFKTEKLQPLWDEGNELVSILVATSNSTRKNME